MRERALKSIEALRRSALCGEFVSYFLVSAVALAVDWSLLILLTERFGLHYLASAAIGFSAGLAIGYGLSITLVFRYRSRASAAVELALFCLVGVLGLGLSQILLYSIVRYTGLSYVLAKAPTACLVFLFNFLARRALLFSAGTGRPVRQGRLRFTATGRAAARQAIDRSPARL